jgi:hypothetical protein
MGLFVALLVGCGNRNYTGERRYAISGKVTVDGQPLEIGLISFLPQDQGRVSGSPIEAGVYDIPEDKGPTAGTYRVEIQWNKPTGRKVKDAWGEEIMDEYKEGLPARYHKSSELTAEVSPDQTKFDFDLKSK